MEEFLKFLPELNTLAVLIKAYKTKSLVALISFQSNSNSCHPLSAKFIKWMVAVDFETR